MGRHAPHSCCDVRGSRRSRATRRTPNGCLATVIRHGNVAIHRSADSPRRGDLAASPPGFPKGLPLWAPYVRENGEAILSNICNVPPTLQNLSTRDQSGIVTNHIRITSGSIRITIESFRDHFGIKSRSPANLTTIEGKMDKSVAAARLQMLANVSEKRPKAAQLRSIIDDVELALSAGISRQHVRDELASLGLDMTLNVFALTLKRIRRERRHCAQSSFPVPPEIAPATSREQRENPTPAVASKQARNEKSDASVFITESIGLPDDWMTAELTPVQIRSLTPTQRRARTQAKTSQYFPNRFQTSPVVES
jgi:hypothetical protein